MSLFSSIQLANNALIGAQIGLQVVGNNIANANTPGYLREEVVLAPGQTYRVGNLLFGLGVDVIGIVQKVDLFLEERLRNSQSDLSNSEAQEQAYVQLETVIGELSDTDLSTSLQTFFASISDVINQPESVSVRNLAVLLGSTLSDEIKQLRQRVDTIRSDFNQRFLDVAGDVNRILREVADLNIRITTTEGGVTSGSQAVGLRDQRQLLMSELSKVINIKAVEQTDGSVTIFAGSDYLVFQGLTRDVEVVQASEDGAPAANVIVKDTKAAVQSTSGELAGIRTARDEILAGYLDNLDEFAQTLIFEFNKVYSGGQGQAGFSTIQGEFSVSDGTAKLDDAGLQFTPVNGSFEFHVVNNKTGLRKTEDVFVRLNGLKDDTSINDIVAQIDAIDGITANLTPTLELQIIGSGPDVKFTFGKDTSGALAALGINTFFSGSSASDIDVHETVRNDPGKFAASQNGTGVDVLNALELARFQDKRLDTAGGATLTGLYDTFTANTAQSSAVAQSVAEGFRIFNGTLEGQKLAVSGVSIDEEAIKMITYQRAFQAAAKFIKTVSDLLELLVQL